jgi:hypothetical protein
MNSGSRQDEKIHDLQLATGESPGEANNAIKEPDPENGQADSTASSDLPGDDVNSKHENDTKIPKRSTAHNVALVFILCLAQVMLQSTLSQSLVPLSYINESFGLADPGEESWPTAAFSLTVGTFILPAGRLGDMYGHKR